MAIDPFCLFRTLGLCKDPSVEVTQPEWWVNLPNPNPAPPPTGLDSSIRMPACPQSLLTRSVEAIDVRESETEIYCMQAAASTYYLPANQRQQQQSSLCRAYATAATPPKTTYPVSSRGSSDSQSGIPGFFGHLPIGKGRAPANGRWGLSASTEASSRGTSHEHQTK